MKLSYTIRGWKDRDWSQLCAAAVDTRLQGLEIDSVKNPIMQKKMSPINPELAVAAHRRLAEQDSALHRHHLRLCRRRRRRGDR